MIHSTEKFYKENSKATVTILVYDKRGNFISQGSGFIVRPEGAVVTNYHIVESAVDIKIKTGDKILNVEGVLYVDKKGSDVMTDVVILKASGDKFPIVKLGDIRKVKAGEKIYIISSPEGSENIITERVLNAIVIDKIRNINILQITGPVAEGSSGGAVFNENGEVIGIVTFGDREGDSEAFTYALSVDIIKDKISNQGIISFKDAGIKWVGSAAYWFYRGNVYQDLNEYEKAKNAYIKAIKLSPDFAKAYFSLSTVCDELGLSRASVEAAKQAIKLKPNYVEAYYNLGAGYMKLDNYKEAIDAFNQAIKLKSDYAEAHFLLGALYVITKNKELALKQYDILKNLNSDLADPLYINLQPQDT